MQNRFFTTDMLQVLSDVQSWRFVGSSLPIEVEPTDDMRHSEWMKSHRDSHSHREIMLVLRGSTSLGYMGSIYPASPGMVFLIDSFEEHDSYYPEDGADISHLWFYLIQDRIRFQVIQSTGGVLNYSMPGGWWLGTTEQLSVQIRHLFFDPDKLHMPAEFLRFRAQSALAAIFSAAIETGYREPQRHKSYRERIIVTIRKHIEESAGRGVSISSLSMLSGYSPYHLQRLFKQQTGVSIHRYIDECRITKLRQMEKAGHPRKEIAVILGFAHQSSFTRWRNKVEREEGF